MTTAILKETLANTITRIAAYFAKKTTDAAGEFTEEMSKTDVSSFKGIL